MQLDLENELGLLESHYPGFIAEFHKQPEGRRMAWLAREAAGLSTMLNSADSREKSMYEEIIELRKALREMARRCSAERRSALDSYRRYYPYFQALNYAPIAYIEAHRKRVSAAFFNQEPMPEWRDGA